MPITIRDVARAAGVSITTVSRALNGYPDVSLETRKNIQKIAIDMNYRPSNVARSLVMQRTRTIGLLVSDLTKDRGGHHFMFDVLCGLHDKFAELGYDVTLVSTNTAQQRLTSYLDFCTQRRLDGVIVMGIRLDDPYVHEVVESPLPSVVIDLPLLSEHCGYVMTDNINGARFAVRELLAQGHEVIGMVNGHSQAAVSKDRLRGYQETLESAGLKFDPDFVYEGDFTLAGGERGFLSLIERHPEITAIFFASDLMAIGAMGAAQRKGIRIPDDISMIGFDNIDLAQFVKPTLSTVGQKRYEMGESAAGMLISMLEEGATPEGRMLPPQLHIRESS